MQRSAQKIKVSLRKAKPFPLGATYFGEWTQFCVFSRNAKKIKLLFFELAADSKPSHTFVLKPDKNRIGDIWLIALDGVRPGQLYGFEVSGPYDPIKSHRFNHYKLLSDPHAKALTHTKYWKLDQARGFDWTKKNDESRDLILSKKRSHPYVPKSIVVDDCFDWEDDQFPGYSMQDTILYELHVRGYTKHKSSNVDKPGTYLGLTEKIPYLKKLGITAIELLPIHEFDENENYRKHPETGVQLKNYWGYSTLGFFAPKGTYAHNGHGGEQVREFKEMIKAFHKAGIEVLLDVVFNHTIEGNEMGPTISFRGFENSIFYLLHEERYYKNYSGCGNAVNANHPVVQQFILDCLRYWVIEMHVDGFRFDLASILSRGQDGEPLPNPPILERIAEDSVLRDTKIIAEAWDAAGLYQVGAFPGGRWAEWNGRYRDGLRSFWRGDPGQTGEMATRLSGSSDLYRNSGRSPWHSVHFITSHDGFTLNDLVSYNEKHNLDNAENNGDGDNHNISYNYGFEGPTNNKQINQIRFRQRKNFIASLFLSRGVPMINAGDEIGRSQKGNNNPWCQDNEISWMDWNNLKTEKELFNFFRFMISFRKKHSALRRDWFFHGNISKGDDYPDVSWYNMRGLEMTWHQHAKSLNFLVSGLSPSPEEPNDVDFYVVLNAHERPLHFRFPALVRHQKWKCMINTGNPAPHDTYKDQKAPIYKTNENHIVESRSLIVFTSSTRLEK